MILWTAFILLMAVMLVIDLGLNRHSHTVSFRAALCWSLIWIALAFAFNCGIWYFQGTQRALEFLSGYLIEKSLSVDNLFVFVMIFSAFGIRDSLQTKVLKWGIIGAVVMRVLFILAGSELLKQFQWLFHVFGLMLMYTAVKMAFGSAHEMHPEGNLVVRLARKYLPVTRRIHGDWFIRKKCGMVLVSPLLVALLVVETTDVIFALDSIPAVFAITVDPFIVLTSNIFAIMGLRALYFLLARFLGMFLYLKYGISFILLFVGLKMIAGQLGFHVPIAVSLAVIVLSLMTATAASVIAARRAATPPSPRHPG